MNTPIPSADRIDAFLRHQMDLFNAGDHDAFLAAFREIAPGGFNVEDPVGSPVRTGWQVLEDLCERYAGWRLELQDIKVNGNHAAIYVKNTGIYEGKPLVAFSIETYEFRTDGSMLVKYYHPTT